MFLTVNERHTDIMTLLNPFFKCKPVVAWLLLNLTPLQSLVPPKTTAVAHRVNRFDKLFAQIYL